MESESTTDTPEPGGVGQPEDQWWVDHFDHASPVVAADMHEVLRHMRSQCPVAHSEAYGGHWVVTRHADVLRVAQDWRTFSSAEGVGLTKTTPVVPPIPEWSDPPVQREYKRLINLHLTAPVVARYEEPIRQLAKRLIDDFIERGHCEFMAEFARPFPGLAFFEQVLHAPSDQIAQINEMSTAAATPNTPTAARPGKGFSSGSRSSCRNGAGSLPAATSSTPFSLLRSKAVPSPTRRCTG